MSYRFRGVDGVPDGVDEKLWRPMVTRAFRSLQSGLTRLAFPDLHRRSRFEPLVKIPGNLDAEMVEVEATANGTEVRIDHALGIIAENAWVVVPGQPVVWGPGTTRSATGVLYRTPHVPDGVTVTFPFKARFLVFGARDTEVPR